VDGRTYKGITNYGARPTFADETVVTETYLDGFSGDLYGKTLRVEFIRRLRGVVKFDSVDALQKQLMKDIERVKTND
jgi:riboflavin kinase/FMN adenylyltransferase